MADPGIEPEDDFEGQEGGGSDVDSALGVGQDSLTSVTPSIFQFQEENGRTYHALSRGKYQLPNDEMEIERLDIQSQMFLLTLDGAQAMCPKDGGARRVLDLGTGTGVWAIEYADRYPEAEVIGVDLSPVQPTFVPPNCIFEIDDIEEEWTWSKPFDFIFARMLAGSFINWPSIIAKAYKALEPGGYFEIQDNDARVECDDGHLRDDDPISQWSDLSREAYVRLGRTMASSGQYKQWMIEAGFEDVHEHVRRWPINKWPRDEKLKELGAWNQVMLDSHLEGLSMALFTRGLGWTREETISFCIAVRKDVRNTNIHAYIPIFIVYGRKPLDDKSGKWAAGPS